MNLNQKLTPAQRDLVTLFVLSGSFGTLDWNKGTQWLFLFPDGAIRKYSRAALLDGQLFQDFPNSVIFVDRAHYRARLGRSLAQIYDTDEQHLLTQQAEKHNCLLMAFPERLAWRAKSESGLEDNDENLLRSYRQYIMSHHRVAESLALCSPLTDKQQTLYAVMNLQRQDTNERLNINRACAYDTQDAHNCHEKIVRIFDSLSEETLEWFRIKRKRNGEIDWNRPRVMSIYTNVFLEDGTLRVTPEGNFIGLDYIWHVLKMHHYHGGGGTARSNLMWHMLRPAEKNVEDKQAVRASFRKALKEMIRALRDA